MDRAYSPSLAWEDDIQDSKDDNLDWSDNLKDVKPQDSDLNAEAPEAVETVAGGTGKPEPAANLLEVAFAPVGQPLEGPTGNASSTEQPTPAETARPSGGASDGSDSQDIVDRARNCITRQKEAIAKI
jgi:hypothetical protein